MNNEIIIKNLYLLFLKEKDNIEAIGDYGRNKKDYILLKNYIKNWGCANNLSDNEIILLTNFVFNDLVN